MLPLGKSCLTRLSPPAPPGEELWVNRLLAVTSLSTLASLGYQITKASTLLLTCAASSATSSLVVRSYLAMTTLAVSASRLSTTAYRPLCVSAAELVFQSDWPCHAQKKDRASLDGYS